MTHLVNYRTVATFPLNGDLERAGGYSVLITEDENGNPVHGLPRFTLVDHTHGFHVIRSARTIGEAVAACLGNNGWAEHRCEPTDPEQSAAQLAESPNPQPVTVTAAEVRPGDCLWVDLPTAPAPWIGPEIVGVIAGAGAGTVTVRTINGGERTYSATEPVAVIRPAPMFEIVGSLTYDAATDTLS